jgi:hypothetical protein
MSATTENYLRDLGFILKERAFEAKRDFHAATEGSAKEFQGGRYMAYYEVISLILSQAEAFGISSDSLALQDIEPERDLLG